MHWITCMMLEYRTHGERYPGRVVHWDSGLLSYWREMNNSLAGVSAVSSCRSIHTRYSINLHKHFLDQME